MLLWTHSITSFIMVSKNRLSIQRINSKNSKLNKSNIDYLITKANRSVVPRRPDFNQFYAVFCDRQKLPKNCVIILDVLQDILEEYQSANEGSISEFHCFEQTESETQLFIMSIITALMKKVYENGIVS